MFAKMKRIGGDGFISLVMIVLKVAFKAQDVVGDIRLRIQLRRSRRMKEEERWLG